MRLTELLDEIDEEVLSRLSNPRRELIAMLKKLEKEEEAPLEGESQRLRERRHNHERV